MIIDMRYHLTTLISVFFALGLGILIGTSINSDGQLLQKQASLIDAIDDQLSLLRVEKEHLAGSVQQLNQELAVYRSFAARLVSQTVVGRLDQKEISLVTLTSDALVKQVEELLEAAGAQVVSHARISEPQALTGIELAAANTLGGELLTNLINGMQGRVDHRSNLVRWVKAGTHMAQQVVVVGSEQVSDAVRSLVKALAQNQVPVIAAVTEKDLRPFRIAGVKVVSDISTPMGLLALVEMLER
ncbi:MAG TPA: copper transporter [Firmicutes bacterium]|nr:copper transporter [Bacillota bacterium]